MRLLDALAEDLDREFPRLVAAHGDTLHAVAHNTCRHAQDAEDTVAETLYRAYRALRSYEPERIRSMQLRPWLVTILRNVWRNEIRHRQRHPEELGARPDGPRAPGADDEALAGVGEPQLVAALRRLDETARWALLLRHVVGMPYTEIAAVMNMPVGTAKAQVSRTISRLRADLSKGEHT